MKLSDLPARGGLYKILQIADPVEMERFTNMGVAAGDIMKVLHVYNNKYHVEINDIEYVIAMRLAENIKIEVYMND